MTRSPFRVEATATGSQEAGPSTETFDEQNPSADQVVSSEAVKRKALHGIGLLGARNIIIRLLGVGATIALARLLTPQDFGIMALGSATVAFATILGEGGIGAALIRGRRPPERADLQSMFGFQLVLTLVLALCIAAVAVNFGTTGRFLALVSIALPISAFKAPGIVMLERELAYRPLAVVETVETAAYYGCAVLLVALGAGVWGVGVGMIFGAATGVGVLLVIAPASRLFPRFEWSRLRHLLGFGIRFQAVDLSWVSQQQALNFGVAAIASSAVLGVWSLATKLLQLPLLLYETLWRVSFSTMASLLRADADPAPSLQRGTRAVAVVSGLLIAMVVGSGPALIPTVFGSQWHAAIALLPDIGLALAISGPVSVAAMGYLFAVGEASTALRASVAYAVAQLVITFPLLVVIGAQAIGVGMVVAAVVEVAILEPAVRRVAGARLVVSVLPATAASAAAAAAAWTVSLALGSGLTALLASSAVAGATYVVAALGVERRGVSDALRMARRSFERSPVEVR